MVPLIGGAAKEIRFNQSEALLRYDCTDVGSDTSSVWQNFCLRFPSLSSFRGETGGGISSFLRLKVTKCVESNHLIKGHPLFFFSAYRRPTDPNFWHFQKKKKRKEKSNDVVTPFFT